MVFLEDSLMLRIVRIQVCNCDHPWSHHVQGYSEKRSANTDLLGITSRPPEPDTMDVVKASWLKYGFLREHDFKSAICFLNFWRSTILHLALVIACFAEEVACLAFRDSNPQGVAWKCRLKTDDSREMESGGKAGKEKECVWWGCPHGSFAVWCRRQNLYF